MITKKKTIALVFSDLHIGDWNNFETRCDTALNILSYLSSKASYKSVPLLFCGDLFDKPDRLSNKLYQRVVRVFKNINDLDMYMYAISGNHDMDTVTKLNISPKSWNNAFSKSFKFLISLDFKSQEFDGFKVYGIPYIDHNNGLIDVARSYLEDGYNGKRILLIHTDYPGAKDNSDYEVGSSENLDLGVLSRFDLVLCGHIHKPQKLADNTYMIGAPYQQSRGDRGAKLGYWKIYSDMTMKFVPLEGYPEFIDVESQDQVGSDQNYYTVITPVEIPKESQEPVVTRDMSKTKMVKEYLKAIGEDDRYKKKLLLNILKRAESC